MSISRIMYLFVFFGGHNAASDRRLLGKNVCHPIWIIYLFVFFVGSVRISDCVQMPFMAMIEVLGSSLSVKIQRLLS